MDMKKSITTIQAAKPSMQGYVAVKDKGAGRFHYYCQVDGVISGPEPWYRLIEVLDMAKDGDEVTLLFSSYGGWIATGAMIANAIRHSKAEVHGVVISLAASIAAMMLCACTDIKAMPLSSTMFHGPSGGVFGKTADMRDCNDQMISYFTELLRKVGTRIITTEEIDTIINKRIDMFVPAETVNARQVKEGDDK